MVDLDVPVNVTGNAVGAVGGVAGAAAQDTAAAVIETGGTGRTPLRNGSDDDRVSPLPEPVMTVPFVDELPGSTTEGEPTPPAELSGVPRLTGDPLEFLGLGGLSVGPLG
ncbi:hypothetical protein [Marinitenerispora sediminis]|uniref:hypothetical protein n=1 Tax=Marinitenerispora sediminis TaxID=1931232 RepID=UPI002162A034|nr:hypothetical protein [Marinitenerispora sediminis]